MRGSHGHEDRCKLNTSNHTFGKLCLLNFYHHRIRTWGTRICPSCSVFFWFAINCYRRLSICQVENKSCSHSCMAYINPVPSQGSVSLHIHSLQCSYPLFLISTSRIFSSNHCRVFSFCYILLGTSPHKTCSHKSEDC